MAMRLTGPPTEPDGRAARFHRGSESVRGYAADSVAV